VHTAWDLALATQALSYLKPDVALAISNVYTEQNSFHELEKNFGAAAFSSLSNADTAASGSYRPGGQVYPGVERLAPAMLLFLGDANVKEPQLLDLYQKVLPQIGLTKR
jgi:hypothetical protein